MRVCVCGLGAPSGAHNPKTLGFRGESGLSAELQAKPRLQAGGAEELGRWGRRRVRGGRGLYQLLHITERRLFARQRSAAAVLGRQTHPLAAACRTRLTEHIGLYLV